MSPPEIPAERLFADVRGRLDRLGPGATDVADALRALGIRGHRKMARACPLAAYLAREFPDCDLAVSSSWVFDEGSLLPERPWRVLGPMPGACAAFATNFDNGHYPDLVDND